MYNLKKCPSCDSTCKKGCWAQGPENCQKFNKINCSPQCSQRRCYGSTENECCHELCAGGCTGSTQKDCFACRNFNDDGECKKECSAIQIKNPTNDLWEPNPDGKYAYGDICVKKCPELMLEHNGTCVHSCSSNKMDENGVCVPCVGCLKTCQINQIVHFETIDIFQGCNIIEGPIDIWGSYLESSYMPCVLAVDRLENLFSSVKVITGYLSIREFHCLKDLSFLKNLEVIGGKQLDPIRNVSLLIMDTSLKSLGLKSLKRIDSGAVAIAFNPQLCYVEDINWNQIQKSQNPHNSITFNRNSTVCKLEKQICSEECTSDGCWGSGSDQCYKCKNDIYNGSCLATCKSLKGVYQIDKKTCGDCHQECKESCSGPNADNCHECANVKDDEFCVSECPVSKYSEDGICLNCHESCNSCTGPRNTFAVDGCTVCDHAIIIGDATIDKCLKKNTLCPDGYFKELIGTNEQGSLKKLAGKSICRQCHPRCSKCSGHGILMSVCLECSGYKRGEQCEDECAENHYADQETRTCNQCDDECQKCHGAGPGNCYSCKSFKLFRNDIKPEQYSNTTFFNCTSVCPSEYKYKLMKCLEDGQASISKFTMDKAHFVICGHKFEISDVQQATELYDIPSVTEQWIQASVRLGKLASCKPYAPISNKIFSNCRLHSEVLRFKIDANFCTNAFGVAYVKAMSFTKRPIIVAPDWIIECVKLKKQIDVNAYHPSLLLTSTIKPKIGGLTLDIAAASAVGIKEEKSIGLSSLTNQQPSQQNPQNIRMSMIRNQLQQNVRPQANVNRPLVVHNMQHTPHQINEILQNQIQQQQIQQQQLQEQQQTQQNQIATNQNQQPLFQVNQSKLRPVVQTNQPVAQQPIQEPVVQQTLPQIPQNP
ncbi:unnamed protein product [Diamesa hyperborea]